MAPRRRVINVRVFALAKCIKGVQTEETKWQEGRKERTNGYTLDWRLVARYTTLIRQTVALLPPSADVTLLQFKYASTLPLRPMEMELNSLELRKEKMKLLREIMKLTSISQLIFYYFTRSYLSFRPLWNRFPPKFSPRFNRSMIRIWFDRF